MTKFLSCWYSESVAILYTLYPNGNCYKRDIMKDTKAIPISKEEYKQAYDLAKYADYFEEGE